tara:strand:- start:4301 stop:4774 length:474 start_codon:yes stop_codon:yes gene_type:complete
MKLTQYYDEVTLSDIQSAHRIEIKFKGTFMLDFADGIRGLIDKNILSISIRGQLTNELLFKYKGNIRILSAVAYDIDDNKKKIVRKTVSDEIQKIASKWDSSTMKYEEYNKNLNARGKVKSLMSYKVNGVNVFRDINNKKILKEELNNYQSEFYNID